MQVGRIYNIMNNYNSSSYYRANPYKDIGYMPPMAQKNRRSPEHTGQIPQGQQYFQPSAKKHYGYTYSNQIQDSSILKPVDSLSPLEHEAMQRSYFRSLNSKDIEGSSTNTLISKAVKNKQKAQQELQRRKEIERSEAEAKRLEKEAQERERDGNKRGWVEQYHRQVVAERGQALQQQQQQGSNGRINVPPSENRSPEPHIDEKKRRESQLLRLAQQRKNYAIVDFPGLYNRQQQGQTGNSSVVVQSQPNFHHTELQKRRKTQRDGGQDPDSYRQEVKKVNNYQPPAYQNIHSDKYYQDSLQNARNSSQKLSNPYNQYNSKNYQQQRQQKQQYQQHQYYNQQKYQQKPGSDASYRNPDYHIIEKDQIRKYQDYSLPYENISPITQMAKNQQNKAKLPQQQPTNPQYYTRKQQPNLKIPQNYVNEPSFDSKYSQNIQNANNNNNYNNGYGQEVPQPFRNREELRRHNPTYLSYGSPTFTLASRNVIGG